MRVRSPHSPQLAEALQREGIATSAGDDHALLVLGATSERVGDIAFAAGVAALTSSSPKARRSRRSSSS